MENRPPKNSRDITLIRDYRVEDDVKILVELIFVDGFGRLTTPPSPLVI